MAEPQVDLEADLAVDQLSAVHSVLTPTRRATEYDILITTAMERLRGGAATVYELVDHMLAVWPGTGVDEGRTRAAMGVAEAAGYCEAVLSGDGWALSKLGAAELASSRDWAERVLGRFRDELQERMTAVLGRDVNPQEAALLGDVLIGAINRGVAFAGDAFKGEIDLLSDRTLAPRSIDRSMVGAAIAARVQASGTSEALKALALEIVDPASPFGNELVGHITTGHMLQAFLARRDALRQRTTIGDIARQRIVIDTPVLIALLGPESTARPIEAAIKAAVAASMDVIVADHSITELLDLLDRIERDSVAVVVEGLKQGADLDVLAESINEPVLALWLRGCQAGRYAHWSDFREAARRLDGGLVRMGVSRRAHGNREPERVAAIRQALQAEAGHLRGMAQIERDANSAEMVWRSRRQSDPANFWPGGWLVTPDTHIRRAYRAANPADAHPLTLSVPQWIALLSSFCQPATLDELATAAASSLAYDSMLAVAGKFPPRTAVEIAKALRGEASAATEIRMAQLTVDDLMRELPVTADEVAAGARVAAVVVALRGQRLSEAHRESELRLATEKDRATALAAKQVAVAQAAEGRREDAEAKAAGSEHKAVAAERTAARANALANRKVLLGSAITALVVAGVFLFLLKAQLWGFGTAGAGAMLFALGREWAADPEKSSWSLLAAAIPEVLPLGEAAARFFGLIH